MKYKIFDTDKQMFLTQKEFKRLVEIRAEMYNDETKNELKDEAQEFILKNFEEKLDLFIDEFEDLAIIKNATFKKLDSWILIDTDILRYQFGFEEEQKAIKFLNKIHLQTKRKINL